MPGSLEGAVDAQVQPPSVNFDHWLRIVYCVVRFHKPLADVLIKSGRTLSKHCGDGAGGHLSRLCVRAGQVGCPCRPDAVACVCVTSTGGVEKEEVIGPGK